MGKGSCLGTSIHNPKPGHPRTRRAIHLQKHSLSQLLCDGRRGVRLLIFHCTGFPEERRALSPTSHFSIIYSVSRSCFLSLFKPTSLLLVPPVLRALLEYISPYLFNLTLSFFSYTGLCLVGSHVLVLKACYSFISHCDIPSPIGSECDAASTPKNSHVTPTCSRPDCRPSRLDSHPKNFVLHFAAHRHPLPRAAAGIPTRQQLVHPSAQSIALSFDSHPSWTWKRNEKATGASFHFSNRGP